MSAVYSVTRSHSLATLDAVGVCKGGQWGPVAPRRGRTGLGLGSFGLFVMSCLGGALLVSLFLTRGGFSCLGLVRLLPGASWHFVLRQR